MQTVKIDAKQRQVKSKENFPALMTLPENPARNSSNKVQTKNRDQLSIHGYKLQNWLDSLKKSDGIYYLDLDVDGLKHYSMHFCHHTYNEVMELDYYAELKEFEDPRKEFLEALIFDLSLFPDEPILVFDRLKVGECLWNLAAIYYEHKDAISAIIIRITNMDMLKVFKSEVYNDPRIENFTLEGIYNSLYPGTSISFPKAQGSYKMHLIILAVKSTLYQIIGKKNAA
jgi:Domain of unknown function(DUF2779)